MEAVQWFKNGDHPEDESELISPHPDSVTQFEPFLSEGKIVRRFNDPDIPGDSICANCGRPYSEHGWLETIIGLKKVCPGDIVVNDPAVIGTYFLMSPMQFYDVYGYKIGGE